jgi:hypothetical protein
MAVNKTSILNNNQPNPVDEDDFAAAISQQSATPAQNVPRGTSAPISDDDFDAALAKQQTNSPKSIQVGAYGVDTDAAQQDLKFAGDVFNKFVGNDTSKPKNIKNDTGTDIPEADDVVNPATVETAKKTVGTEIQGAQDFIKKDLNTLIPTLPDAAKDILSQAKISPDDFANELLSTDSGKDALKNYYSARMKYYNSQYENDKAALNIQTLNAQTPSDIDNPELSKPAADYKSSLDELNKNYKQQTDNFNNSMFGLASLKAVQTKVKGGTPVANIEPYEIGAEIDKMMGNGTSVDAAAQDWKNNGNVDPAIKVNRELLGYQALQYAGQNAFAQGDNTTAQQLAAVTKNYPQKVLANNPAFVKQQVIDAISDNIYKKSNWFYNSITGYAADQSDIDASVKELGINPKDAEGITPDDIKTVPSAPVKVLGGAMEGTVPIANIVINGVKATKDEITGEPYQPENPEWFANTGFGKSLGLQNPDANAIYQNPTYIQSDSHAANYLQNIPNPEAGKFNTDAGAIAGEVYSGLGGILPMAAGQEAGSAVAIGSGLVKNPEVASRLGLGAYTFLSGYDNNYQQAASMVGDNPEDESKRVALASLYSAIQAATVQLLPQKDIVSKWGTTDAGNELVSLISKKGFQAVDQEAAKSLITRGLEQVAKSGKELGLLTAQGPLNVAGNAIGDMIFAPKAAAQKDYWDDTKRSVVTGAISGLVPVGLGAFHEVREGGPMFKKSMYEVGSNPEQYLTDINDQLTSGKIDQGTANDKIKIVSTLKDIVANSVPDRSIVNGNALTDQQKIDYTHNLLADAVANQQKTSTSDPVQAEHIDTYIKNLRTDRNAILQNAGESAPVAQGEAAGSVTPESTDVAAIPADQTTSPSIAPEHMITVGEMIDKPVTLDGRKATLYQDGQTVVAKYLDSPDGKVQERELGNIDQVKDHSIKDYGMEQENSVVGINDNGQLQVRGKEYHNLYSDPLQAINYDKDNNVVSVNLETPDGEKRTFRGDVAEDLAYQIHLKELDKRNYETNGKEGAEHENFINSDQQSREVLQSGGNEEAAAPGADQNNEAVSRAPVERTPRPVAGDISPENPGDSAAPKAETDQYGFELTPKAESKSETPAEQDLFTQKQPDNEKANAEAQTKEEGQKNDVGNTEAAQAAPVSENALSDNTGSKFFDARTPEEQTESDKVGQNIKDKFSAAEKVLGHPRTKLLSDGSKLKGRYVLTDADAITPSHDPRAGFRSSDGFPMQEDGRNPNDRDYTNNEVNGNVRQRANDYDGRAVENIPTVDKNGVVIDGNDRAMSGQLAADNGTDTKYLDTLKENAASYGFTPEQIQQMEEKGLHPRVVFVPDSIQPYSTDTFSKFNPRTTGKVKTAVEQAVTFARTMPDELLGRLANVMNAHETVSKFFNDAKSVKDVRNLLERFKITDKDNAKEFFKSPTEFTTHGKELMQNMMLGKSFGEDELKLLQEHKDIREKVLFAINNIAGIEALGENYSLKGKLNEALHLWDVVEKYKEQNDIKSMADAYAQYTTQGTLHDEPFSEGAKVLFSEFADSKKSALREMTKAYLRSAKDHAEIGADMFGNLPASREELLNQYNKIKEDERVEAAKLKRPANPTIAAQSERPVDSEPNGNGAEAAGTPQEASTATEQGSLPQSGEPEPVAEPESKINAAGERPFPDNLDDEENRGNNIVGEPDASTEIASAETEDDPYTAAVKKFNLYNDAISVQSDRLERGVDKEGNPLSKDDRLKAEKALHDNREKLLRARKNLDREEKRTRNQNKKPLAEKIRSKKINPADLQRPVDPNAPHRAGAVDDELVKQLGVKVYNGALEFAARLVESGEKLKDVIDKTMSWIQDRHFGRLDEQKMRDMLGENALHPLTGAELRDRTYDASNISSKDRDAAANLLKAVEDNKHTLKSAVDYIKNQPRIPEERKQSIIAHLRGEARAAFDDAGKGWADDYLTKQGGDFDKALTELGKDYDTRSMNANSDIERENLRSRYAAAKADIESQKTLAAVKDGTIKPVAPRPLPADASDQLQLGEYNVGRKIKQATQNRYSRLEEAQRKSKVPITPENDAATAQYLKKSKAATLREGIQHFLGSEKYQKGSFYDRLKKAGIDIHQFGLYLYAKHAEERNEQNAKDRQEKFDSKVYDLNQRIAAAKDPDVAQKYQDELTDILNQKDYRYVLMPDGGSGMTNAQADEILKAAKDDGKFDEYEKFGKEFKENVVDKILDYKHESGLIDNDTYAQLKDHYKNYVPLKVDLEAAMEADGLTPEEASTMAIDRKNSRDLYKSKGASDRTYFERHNPVLQSIIDVNKSIDQGEENKASKVLANLVKGNPNPAVWETRPAQYDILKNKEGKVISATETNKPADALEFFDNGKKNYIIMRDQGMKFMLKKVGNNTMLKMVSGVSRLVSATATLYNPEFIAKNLVYDQQDAYLSLLAQDNKQVVKNFRSYVTKIPSLMGALGGKDNEWSPWIKSWKDHGGEISFMENLNMQSHGKVTQKMFDSYGETFSKSKYNALKSHISDVGGLLEKTTRVMAYRAAVEGGITEDGAANISRNATVDFEKKGVYGTYINAFKAFGTAATAGLSNLLYLGIKSPRVRGFLGAMVVSGIAEAELNRALSDCSGDREDCYGEVPEYVKEKYFMVPLAPMGGHGYARVPIGRAFGWFNYVGKTFDGLLHGEQDAGDFTKNIIGSMVGYYSPVGDAPLEQQLGGNILGPVIGLKTNTNSFGKPIEPENKTGVVESQNHWKHTPEIMQKAADFLHEYSGGEKEKPGLIEVSPDKLNFIMQTAFSGVYSFLGNTGATVSSLANGETPRMNSIPFARTFYGTSEMANSKDAYYNLADKAKTSVLSDEDYSKVNSLLDGLEEGGQFTPDQKAANLNYIDRQQKYLKHQQDKRAGEESSSSSDSDTDTDTDTD